MRRIGRKVARGIAWVALSAVLLLLIAATTLILWARSPSGRRLLLSTVVSTLQKQLAGRVTIGALDGDLTRRIVLRQVRLYDRERRLAVAIDAIVVEHDPIGLLSRELRLRALKVEGARVHVRPLRDGTINLAALAKKRPPAASKPANGRSRPWALVVDDVRIDARVVAEPVQGALAITGGLAWRDGEPAFHDLRARFVTAGAPAPLAAPIAATLRLDGAADAIAAELGVAAGHGEVRAQARASLARGGPLRWRATIASHDLDPGALVPGAPHGAVALAAHGHGEDATGWLVIDRLGFDAAGTHASLHGTVERGPMLLADLQAELRSPDLSRLTGDALPALHGRIEAHAQVRRTSAHTYVDAEATVRGLRAGAVRVASLDARAHAQDLAGRVEVSARDLEASAVRVHSATLTATGDEERLTLAFAASGTHGRHAELRAHGVPLPAEGRWGLDLAIDRVVAGDGETRWRATVPGHLRIERDAVIGALALAAHQQTLALDGTLGRHDGRLAVDLHGRALDAGRLLLPGVALPHTQLDVDAELRGTRAAPQLRLAVRGRSLPWPQHDLPAIDLVLDAAADARRIHATIDATAREQTLHAAVDAPIDPSADDALAADVEAHAIALAPLRSLLPPSLRSLSGRASLSAHLSGRARDPELTAHLAVPAWALDELPANRLVVDVGYRQARLDARWDAGFGAHDRAGTLVGTLALPLDATRGHGALLARPASAAPLSLRVEARALDLAQLPIERLGAPSGLHVGVVDLTLDAGGTLDAAAAELHANVNGAIRGGGVIAGSAELRGTLAHPIGHAELHGRDLGISELRLTTVDARAAWDGATLTARVDGAQSSGGTLHLDASVPAAAGAPLQATLQADAFTFAIDDVGQVRRLEGTLAADLHVSGPRAHPALRGSLKIDRGAFAGGSDPRLFRDLTLEVAAHDGTVELRRLALHVGRGTLSAHGHATLDGLTPKTIELTVDAERFPFDATNAGAWLNAGITLHGERAGDKLEGAVTVTEGKAHLPSLTSRRALQPTGALEDVVYVDEPEPTARVSQPPDLHVLAHIPGPFRVDAPELHAELSGELDVRTDGGRLGVYGHAETASGQLELLGRAYDIERARVTFDGGIDPTVDVRLTRAMSSATVVIAVHGTAKSPTLELTSDPPVYSQSQVLGLIVSGDPDNARVDSPSTDQQLVGAVSGALVSQLTGQIVSRLPLDVIKVEPGAGASLGGLGGARLEVGKYLRENIYVSYSHQFGATMTDIHHSNAHELSIEYRIRRHLVLGVRYGDAGIGAIDLAWTLRY